MRTFLTSFAVSIGAMLIVLMVSLGVGVQKIVIDALKANTPGTAIAVSPYKLDNNGITITTTSEDNQDNKKEPKFKKIDEAALNKISKMEDVSEISVISNIPAVNIDLNGVSKKTSSVVGMDLNYSVLMNEQIEIIRSKEKNNTLNPISYGKMLTKDDTNSVLIGEKMLTKLGVKDFSSIIGKEISLTATLPDAPGIPKLDPLVKKLKIVGVINEKFPNSEKLIISINDAKPILAYINLDNNYYENKGPEAVNLVAKSLTAVPKVSDEISKLDYGVTSIQSMLSGVKSAFIIAQAILSIIGIIIIFVASIGVINTMTMSIYERTRSIGIMKALGASRKEIRRLFIVESGVIGLIGGIMGIVFSLLNVQIMKLVIDAILISKGITSTPELFSTPIWLILGTITFAIFISILAGLYPAGKASKLDPVESIRYE